ncbi:hypothetical protein MKK50_15825 [Methylobacterium sp. J-043]|nr:hypothetical protein [Methylobacterium sp. J-043]
MHQFARLTVIVDAPTFAAGDKVADAIETALVDMRKMIEGTRVVICSEGVGVSGTVDDPKRYRRALQFDMQLSQ